MTWRPGPRPWAITAFAAAFAFTAIIALAQALGSLDEFTERLRDTASFIEWDRDRAIIFASARFTIVLIPIIAVWGFASHIARVLVTFMTIPSLTTIASLLFTMAMGETVNIALLGNALLRVGAVALLYTKWAAPWFAKEAGNATS